MALANKKDNSAKNLLCSQVCVLFICVVFLLVLVPKQDLAAPREYVLPSPGCRLPLPAHRGRLNSVITVSMFLTEYPGTVPRDFNSQVSDQELKMCLERNRRQWSSNSCPIHPAPPELMWWHAAPTCQALRFFFGHDGTLLQFAKSYMLKLVTIPLQPMHTWFPSPAWASQ